MTSGNAFLAGLTAGYLAAFAMVVTLAAMCPWVQYGAWVHLQHLALATGGISGGIFGQCVWALRRLAEQATYPERERLIQEGSS
jgi:hypothetical protein